MALFGTVYLKYNGNLTMKNIKILILLLCIQANAWADNELLIIEGRADCGGWISGRKNNTSIAYEHYVLGFLNGLVIGSNMDFWTAKGRKLNREQVYLWMDNYCSKNPLSGPSEGVMELMNEQTDGRFFKRP